MPDRRKHLPGKALHGIDIRPVIHGSGEHQYPFAGRIGIRIGAGGIEIGSIDTIGDRDHPFSADFRREAAETAPLPRQ